MSGWSSAEAACASRSNRSSDCRSRATLSGRNFKATNRRRRRILGFVHNAHTATAQLRDDAVMGNYSAKYRLRIGHKRCMLLSPRQTSISSPKLYVRTGCIRLPQCYGRSWSHGSRHKNSNRASGALRITITQSPNLSARAKTRVPLPPSRSDGARRSRGICSCSLPSLLAVAVVVAVAIP